VVVWSATFHDLKLLYISPSSEHILGLDPQKLISENALWYQYVHPDDLQIVQNAAKQRELEGKVSTEYRILRTDGSICWIREISEIKYDADNVPVFVEGVLTDINRSKEAEEELHIREERLKSIVSILEYSQDSIQDFLDFALDEAIKLTQSHIGYIYFYNDAKKEFILNSWSKEVMEECSVTEKQTTYMLDHTGLWGEAVRQRREIIVNDFKVHNPLKKGYPEGHVELLKYMTVPVIKNGEVVAVVGVANKESDYNENDVLDLTLLMGSVWDIAEHIKSEQALLEEEARIRVITESAQDAILMMDPKGDISFWNPAAERIIGYSIEEAIGQNLHLFIVPPRYYSAHKEAIGSFLKTGQGNAIGKTLELEALCKDGQEKSIELSLSAIELSDGWHSVGIMRDITSRKLDEKKMLAYADELKTKNKELDIALVKAEEATKAKSEFLANMSHEIRTPMNGVIGMTGLLLETELSDEQRHYTETVRLSGESLLQLINDILDFSKIEAGKLELEMVDFDLHNMLDDFASMVSVKAHEKELEFICAPAPDVPACVQGDPGRLQQVLTNLTGNAIKFTHEGEVVVQVTLESETETEALLRFSVRDTGVGIPENKKHDLFEKFSQVDASTTRQYGGTGLGLAISKQLVEMMGGDIGVESEKGKGSEFWFRISLAKQKESCHEKVHSAEISGLHILIVDDNATNREILNKRLASWGAKVDEAVDGPTALQALYRAYEDSEQYHMVILDMHMPGMDGESVARFIKSDAKLKTVPLVMLSSLGQRSNVHGFGERHFAAYLTKPVRNQELLDVLSGILNTEKQRNKVLTRVCAPSVPSQIHKNLRLLLAEDNIVNQKVAQGMLQKLGYHADTVANGLEAIKALEMVPYDLVLMDVQMPDMDGLDATRLVRNPHSSVLDHEIPIVAMTAYAMKGDKERCLEAGMNDYITKPVSLQALMELLDKWQSILENETSRTAMSTEGIKYSTDLLVFDKPALLERVMDDVDLSRRLIAIFLEDMPKNMTALKDCIGKKELENVNVYAHKIKGASANIGGLVLSAVASQMELAGNKNQVDKMDMLLAELEKQYDQLVDELKDV
jgi:PAS domain S-box-containing protein